MVYNPITKMLFVGVDRGRIQKYDLKVILSTPASQIEELMKEKPSRVRKGYFWCDMRDDYGRAVKRYYPDEATAEDHGANPDDEKDQFVPAQVLISSDFKFI